MRRKPVTLEVVGLPSSILIYVKTVSVPLEHTQQQGTIFGSRHQNLTDMSLTVAFQLETVKFYKILFSLSINYLASSTYTIIP